LEETIVEEIDGAAEQQKSLLNEIDFFKTTHTIVNNKKNSSEAKKQKSKNAKKVEAGDTENQEQDDEIDDEEELFQNQEEVSQKDAFSNESRPDADLYTIFRWPSSESEIESVYMETTYQIPFANLQIFQRHTITFANTYVAI
jgi:hypothetical protein